ncbi:membrane protein [Mucilaginibacter puniceus]
MIKYTKFFITFLFAVAALGARSQSTATTSSPYSRYGLGDLSPGVLPQNAGMGGIATATNRINGYMSINPLNPASYSQIRTMAIDAGLYGNRVSFNQNGQASKTDANFSISHITFAVPITKKSALSFGLLPYSQLGYNYNQSIKGFGTGSPVDTNTVNYRYNGEGGLTKAYFGYGIGIGKNITVGANLSYIWGNLKQTQSTELPKLPGALNSRIEDNNSISGLNYDFGAQYIIDFSLTKRLTLGYSASANSKLNNQNTYIVSQYFLNSDGVASLPVDSVISRQGVQNKIQLPQINHFGVSFQEEGKYLVGVDYSIGKWSNYSVGGVNQGLLDSKTLNIGGQFTPNRDAIGNYWATIDYRLGAIFNQSYLNVSNPDNSGFTNIKSTAITLGLGLPLRPYYQNTFYKVNISAEIGQRGTLKGGLIKENYINLRIGFTLNDRWFQKLKFD